MSKEKEEFKVFFEENKKTISNLKLDPNEFKKVFKLLDSASKYNSLDDMGKSLDKLKLIKPFETVLLVCLTSLSKIVDIKSDSYIENNPENFTDYVENMESGVKDSLFKIFYLLKSPANVDKNISLTSFILFFNILGFSNLCDKTDLLKFMVAVCKKNKFTTSEVLSGMFNSFALYSGSSEIISSKLEKENLSLH